MDEAQFAQPEHLEKEQSPSKLKVSFEEVKDRAFTKTAVLVDILERPERPYLRHWGLNE